MSDWFRYETIIPSRNWWTRYPIGSRQSRSGNHLPWPESLAWRKRASRDGHNRIRDKRWRDFALSQYLRGVESGEATGMALAKLGSGLDDIK